MYTVRAWSWRRWVSSAQKHCLQKRRRLIEPFISLTTLTFNFSHQLFVAEIDLQAEKKKLSWFMRRCNKLNVTEWKHFTPANMSAVCSFTTPTYAWRPAVSVTRRNLIAGHLFSSTIEREMQFVRHSRHLYYACEFGPYATAVCALTISVLSVRGDGYLYARIG